MRANVKWIGVVIVAAVLAAVGGAVAMDKGTARELERVDRLQLQVDCDHRAFALHRLCNSLAHCNAIGNDSRSLACARSCNEDLQENLAKCLSRPRRLRAVAGDPGPFPMLPPPSVEPEAHPAAPESPAPPIGLPPAPEPRK